jgi:hypothetical protein
MSSQAGEPQHEALPEHRVIILNIILVQQLKHLAAQQQRATQMATGASVRVTTATRALAVCESWQETGGGV